MSKEELAEKLNGIDRREDISPELIKIAKENNLVVVFGYSDDGMECRGAIHDEYGAYSGDSFKVYEKGAAIPLEHDDYENVFRTSEDVEVISLKNSNDGRLERETCEADINIIDAIWNPCDSETPNLSWKISSTIPHSTFEMMEDGEVFCIGIVFSIDDLK